MDYKVTGIYKHTKESTFGGSFLHENNGKKYEILEFPIECKYKIEGSQLIVNAKEFPLKQTYVKIAISDTHVFICYRRRLQIFDLEGQLTKEIQSNEQIIPGTGGFLVSDKNRYIVNLSGNHIFVENTENVLDFDEEGTILNILYVPNKSTVMIDELIDSEMMPSEKKSGILEMCSTRGNLLFDKDGECILSFNEYQVFQDTCRIENPIACRNIKLQSLSEHSSDTFKNCTIVLCKDCVNVMFDGIVVRKPVPSGFIKILPERFVVYNYLDECSVYDCLLLMNCIKKTVLYKEEGVQGFLSALLNSKVDGSLIGNFISSLKANEKFINFGTTICRVYRLVDDKARKLLNQLIDEMVLDADQMFYIVIYREDLVKKFIDLCKIQKRLFYLENLRQFYDRTGRTEECKRLLLEAGLLLYEYRGLEVFQEIEKRQIESQRSVYLGYHDCDIVNSRGLKN